MGHSERIHDEAVGQASQLSRKSVIVAFLTRMEAQVFEKAHISRRHFSNRFDHRWTDAIIQRGNGPAQKGSQPLAHRSQAQGIVDLASGSTEVGAQHHLALPLQQVLDGGQGGAQAMIVIGDEFRALLNRHVEVNPDQDGLSVDIQLGERTLGHAATFGQVS
jgi:hypothetical protein